ncbi:MAG: hypothetical protein GXX96_24010 [Planctomycetaceae bacterium]|nr:hypothetical protein [Planctomycetaceae bacterium]
MVEAVTNAGPRAGSGTGTTTCPGPLVLRICGSPREGQIVRLRSAKCTIGSGENCTLRIRARGVQPLHCVLIRKAVRTVVRRWAADTRLNGASFTDAPLHTGDRLSIGPIDFEVLDSGTAPNLDAANDFTASTKLAGGVGKRDSVVERLRAAKDVARKRTEKILGRLREAHRRIEQLTDELSEYETSKGASTPQSGVLDRAADGPHELERERVLLEEAQSLLREQQAERDRRERELRAREADLERLARETDSSREEIAKERRSLDRARDELAARQEELERAVQDAASLRQRSEEAEALRAELEKQCQETDRVREEFATRQEELERAVQDAANLRQRSEEAEALRTELEKQRQEADRVSEELATSQEELERAVQGVASLRQRSEEAEALRAELEKQRQETDRVSEELATRQEELERAVQDAASLRQRSEEAEALRAELEKQRQETDRVSEELAARQEELEQAAQDAASFRERSEEAEALRAELEKQRQALIHTREELDEIREAIEKERETVDGDRKRCETLAAEVERERIEVEQQSGVVARETAELWSEREAFGEEQEKWEAAQFEARKQIEQRAEQLDRQKEALDEQKAALASDRAEWESLQAEAETQLAVRAEQLDVRERELDERIAEFERIPRPSPNSPAESSFSGGLDFLDAPEREESTNSVDLFRRMEASAASNTHPMDQFSELRGSYAEADSEPSESGQTISLREEGGTRHRSVSEILLADPVIADSFVPRSEEDRSRSYRPPAREAGNAEEEESIEAYMASLLARVGGGRSDSGGSTAPAAPAPRSVRRSEELQHTEPSRDTSYSTEDSEATARSPSHSVVEEPVTARTSGPRTRAPERAVDLVTLRELANLSAQTNLDTHARSRLMKSVHAKLGIVAVALGTAGFLFYRWHVSPGSHTYYYMGLAVVLIAILWGVQYAAIAGYAYLTRQPRNGSGEHQSSSATEDAPENETEDLAVTEGPAEEISGDAGAGGALT